MSKCQIRILSNDRSYCAVHQQDEIYCVRLERDELRKVLADVEWGNIGAGGTKYCPFCSMAKHLGHDEQCDLGRALHQNEPSKPK